MFVNVAETCNMEMLLIEYRNIMKMAYTDQKAGILILGVVMKVYS